jgi:hypothetical protein
MFGVGSVLWPDRSRLRAVRALFIRHGAESTPEGRSLLLLRKCLSPLRREQLAKKGYFEVLGRDTKTRFRIHAGASVNVCEVDGGGRRQDGLCFRPIGALPIGDVMLAQKSLWRHAKARRALWQEGLNLTTFISGRLDRSAEDHDPVVAPSLSWSPARRRRGEVQS